MRTHNARPCIRQSLMPEFAVTSAHQPRKLTLAFMDDTREPSPCVPAGLPHFLAAGHIDGLARHIAGLVGGKEYKCIGYILVLRAPL